MDYTNEIECGFQLIDHLLANSADDLSEKCQNAINERYELLLEYEEFFRYDNKRFYLEMRNFVDWMCDEILTEYYLK